MTPAAKNNKENRLYHEKILLALLPFWSSLIPPMGIACLKSFLQSHEYKVKILDANTELTFRQILDRYFAALKAALPQGKRGNFYNLGYTVLRNQMMLHLHCKNEKKYIQILKMIIFNTFFYNSDALQILALKKIIAEFYLQLEKYLLNLLEKEHPDILGLSVYNGTLPASLFAFKLAKQRYPGIRTVMGGGVFTGDLAMGSPNFDDFMKEVTYIDKIIVGEGENLFLNYLNGELPEAQKLYTLKDIKGELMDLNKAEAPDFSHLDIRYYSHLASYTSRSCPYQCAFCSETVFWGKYRKKQPKQIVKELNHLYNKHGTQLFFLSDSLLNPVITDLANELTNSDIAIYWDGYLKVEPLVCDLENTFLWRRAGFYRARLGLESGSKRILEQMGKKVTPEQIKTAVSNLAHAGIKTTTYWLIGYPGETEEDFQQTLDLVTDLKDDIYEADCNPFSYYFTGQVNSDQWEDKRQPLYPKAVKDLLLVQTWILDAEPTREEVFTRVVRFIEHCSKLGIPNPYSINDIYKADQRWRRLKKNAVPLFVDFKNSNDYINENKYIKRVFQAPKTMEHNGDWGF